LVTGQAWLDREWSSQFLQPDQQGWDWFALHLDDGSKLMAFQLRSLAGAPYRHAVRLWPDGRRRQAAGDEFTLQAAPGRLVAGRRLPLDWRLDWPAEDLALQVRAPLDDQWMKLDFPYWEGRVEVLDDDDRPAGKGYLEMTGYPEQEAR
jgi:predicted secreted hydrolase